MLSRIETCLIRALFFAVFVTSGSNVAHAAAPAWAAECAALDADTARLACYDTNNPPRKKAARAQASAPQTTQPQTASSQTTQPQGASAQATRPQAASAQGTQPQGASPQVFAPRATAPQAATASVAAKKDAPASVSDDFGLTQPRKREPDPAKAAEAAELLAQVASVSQRLTGELLLKLDNGQSWAQAQRKSGVPIKAGERVSISRGAFGGYLLRSDSGVSMRVRRLE